MDLYFSFFIQYTYIFLPSFLLTTINTILEISGGAGGAMEPILVSTTLQH